MCAAEPTGVLQARAAPAPMEMILTGDTGRQFDTLECLITLESTGSDEACTFWNDEPRFDGLVRSDEDGVYPETTVLPVFLFEHDARAVKSRAIDALDGLWQNDGGEVLAALESLVADSDDCVGVLPHYDGLGDQ